MKLTGLAFVSLSSFCLMWNSCSAELPLLIAHRGASDDAPENTLAAFRLAWEQNADGIEGDFHLTQDGQIVCIHDKTTKRVATQELTVAKSTLEELRKLDVGSWKDPRFAKERIPTLQEILEILPADKRFFLEVKCGPEIVPVLKKELEAFFPQPGQITIISFDHEVIAAAKKAMPGIPACWLTSFKQNEKTRQWAPQHSEVLNTLKEIQADGLDSQCELVMLTPEFLQTLKQNSYGLHVWTVNDPVVAKEIIHRGVISITTDRPAWLREQLNLSGTAE